MRPIDDIVERLRKIAHAYPSLSATINEGADEIERLRQEAESSHQTILLARNGALEALRHIDRDLAAKGRITDTLFT